MRSQPIRLFFSACLLILLSGSYSFAAITTYTDRETFEDALALLSGEQGTEDFNAQIVRDFTEDADGAISDTDFYSFSISGVTGNSESAAIGIDDGTGIANIDETQFLYWSAKGDHTSPEENFPKFSIVFERDVQAFGFDWSDQDTSDAYGLRVTVESVEYSYNDPPFVFLGKGTGFFGIISDDPLEQIEFYCVKSGGTLSDLGIDNLIFLWLKNDFSWSTFMPAILGRK